MSTKSRPHWPSVTTMTGALIAAVGGGVIAGLLLDGLHYLIG